jgi:hypothetical protein
MNLNILWERLSAAMNFWRKYGARLEAAPTIELLLVIH